MKSWKLLIVLALMPLLAVACSGKKDGAEAPPAAETGETDGLSSGQKFESQRDYKKTTVNGCEGGGGSASSAKAAYEAGDFASCNRDASCAFNASVESNPSLPDANAAFFGFLCKFALLIETPQFEYLSLEKWKASDYFGKPGGMDNLTGKIEAKWPGSPMVALKSYFKSHEDAGHNVEDVFQTLADIFLERLVDWHVLLEAMANTPSFSADIPVNFVNNSSPISVSNVEAGILDFWDMNLLILAETIKLYNVGVTSSDSFNDVATLAVDLNTAPKFASLRANASGASLKAAISEWFYAATRAVGNVVVTWDNSTGKFKVADWVKDSEIFPLHDEANPYELALLAAQVYQSLDNQYVWMAMSENEVALNFGKFLTSLPNSDSVAGEPFKPDGSGIQFNGEFFKLLLKDYFIEK